jgi:hypothetical protein
MNIRIFSFLLLLPLLMGGCKKSAAGYALNAELNVTIDYEKQGGPGSNQWAIWLEDSEGALVKTLFVTRFTAEGGYEPRPACTPLWVSKAMPKDLPKEAIDAFSGATPASGEHKYVWDLTDSAGQPVGEGHYTLMVEATLYGDSEAIYMTPVEIGNEDWSFAPEAAYTLKDATNKGMIRAVNVSYRVGKSQ